MQAGGADILIAKLKSNIPRIREKLLEVTMSALKLATCAFLVLASLLRNPRSREGFCLFVLFMLGEYLRTEKEI